MKHKKIRKFSMEGEFFEDSQIPVLRAQFETLMIHDARSRGYIPVLDLDPLWSTEYDIINDRWKFVMAIYVIYVGRRRAQECEGWTSGKLMPRSTQKVM
jgi:hypothetical protein